MTGWTAMAWECARNGMGMVPVGCDNRHTAANLLRVHGAMCVGGLEAKSASMVAQAHACVTNGSNINIVCSNIKFIHHTPPTPKIVVTMVNMPTTTHAHSSTQLWCSTFRTCSSRRAHGVPQLTRQQRRISLSRSAVVCVNTATQPAAVEVRDCCHLAFRMAAVGFVV